MTEASQAANRGALSVGQEKGRFLFILCWFCSSVPGLCPQSCIS